VLLAVVQAKAMTSHALAVPLHSLFLPFSKKTNWLADQMQVIRFVI